MLKIRPINITFHKFTRLTCLGVLSLILLTGSLGVWAQTKAEMQKRYAHFSASQLDSLLPFTLESTEKNGVISASVKTFLADISFSLFSERLSSIGEWCEFVPLHLNIKACMHEIDGDHSKLGFYIGTKGYMTPDEAELLRLDFSANVVDDVLRVRFTAKTGPFGSANYDFQFLAISQDGGVYFEFDLSSEPGLIANLAKIYLATVGRSKIGFSTTGKSWLGKAKYVRGQRGGSERNIVRYLFSIKAYFETIGSQAKTLDYTRRLEWWFDLTEQYPRQLYELNKADYLAIKIRERKNQSILMDALKNHTIPIYELPHYLP